MISNSSAVPALAGGFIDLAMVKRKTQPRNRRTKIICTIGPACWEVEQLETLMKTGMDVARFNFSHGDHEGHGKVLERLRQAAKNMKREIAVLLDTKGPEIRTGFFAKGNKVELAKGETLIMTSDYSFKGDSKKLACSYAQLATSVKPGQQILIADGSLVLTVQSCDAAAGEVTCRIENNASIGERKNMNLPGVVVDLPTFTEKDVDDIVNFGIKNRVDFIAASFVRKASDVTNLRKLLADNGGSEINIICKIENQEGLENYNAILKETDGIMVARGDLGMEIPPSKVFLAQKMMIREANIAGKPVITATQMLESMISNPRPTRAECSDVANAVYDGTDAVMLSGETANGPYFDKAVAVMANTVCEAETSRNYDALFQSIRNSTVHSVGQLSTGESLASSATKTAIDIDAKLIVVVSESGTTGRLIAKFRPGRFVIVLTPSATVARQCNGLLQGVRAFEMEEEKLNSTEDLVEEVINEGLRVELVQPGDLIVGLWGKIHGRGNSDTVRVHVCNRTNRPAGKLNFRFY